MEQSPSWEAHRFAVSQEILPAFYRTRSCIIAFTRVHHLSLPEAGSIQAITPHRTSWKPILKLSSSRPGSPQCPLLLRFPNQNLVHYFPFSIRDSCPAHLILLGFITRTILGEEHRSLSSSLYSFLHSHVISSLSGPNILVNTIFSNTLSLHSSLNTSDLFSHPYKTTGYL